MLAKGKRIHWCPNVTETTKASKKTGINSHIYKYTENESERVNEANTHT